MKKYANIMAAAAVAGVISIGCADTRSASMGLNGEYKIISLQSNGETIKAPQKATLGVKDDQIYGNSGCNRYFAGFEAISEDMVRFSAGGSTRMMCAPDEMKFEDEFLRILGGEFIVEANGNKVLLVGEKVKIELEK